MTETVRNHRRRATVQKLPTRFKWGIGAANFEGGARPRRGRAAAAAATWGRGCGRRPGHRCGHRHGLDIAVSHLCRCHFDLCVTLVSILFPFEFYFLCDCFVSLRYVTNSCFNFVSFWILFSLRFFFPLLNKWVKEWRSVNTDVQDKRSGYGACLKYGNA